jgi:hypothetical protein
MAAYIFMEEEERGGLIKIFIEERGLIDGHM